MPNPPNDPSVFAEPHMRPAPPPPLPGQALPYASPNTPAPSDHDPGQDIGCEPIYSAPLAQPADIETTVWDEPTLSPELAGALPAGQLTYDRWLAERRANWSWIQSWLATLGLALSAGPFAIVGAFWGAGQSVFSIVMLTVFGPMVEELMKVGSATVVVEKWPFVFRSGGQIMLCALCGGLAFAAIENLLYLQVYVPNPSPRLVLWRWTVCVALHVFCSTIAGLGVRRVWLDCMSRQARPRMSLATPPLIAAVIIHGVYNSAALVMELTGLF